MGGMRRTLMLGTACWTLIGCYSRDNPFDPARCDPRCTGGTSCYDGECRARSDAAADSRGGDAGPPLDGAPERGPAILFSVRQGSTASVTSTAWVDIPGLALTVTASGKESYLVILNVPDTWVTSPSHQSGRFQIVDGTTTLASGLYTAGQDNRLPFTLVAASQLSAGTHTIKAQWRTGSTGYSLNLGQLGSWLVAVRAEENNLVAAPGSFTSDLKATAGSWVDLPGLCVKARATGDHLLVLNVPATSLQATTWFRIVPEDSPSSVIAYGTAQPDTPAFASQGVPMTLVGVKSLVAGQGVKAQWNGTSSSESTIFAAGPPVLVALRPSGGIAHGRGLPSAEVFVSSSSYTAITSLAPSPVPLTTAGGPHLVLFSAPYSVVDTAGASVSYSILVDGTRLAESVSRAGTAWQDLPHTVVGVKELSAGTHQLTAEWKVSGASGAQAVLGKDAPHWLIGLAP